MVGELAHPSQSLPHGGRTPTPTREQPAPWPDAPPRAPRRSMIRSSRRGHPAGALPRHEHSDNAIRRIDTCNRVLAHELEHGRRGRGLGPDRGREMIGTQRAVRGRRAARPRSPPLRRRPHAAIPPRLPATTRAALRRHVRHHEVGASYTPRVTRSDTCGPPQPRRHLSTREEEPLNRPHRQPHPWVAQRTRLFAAPPPSSSGCPMWCGRFCWWVIPPSPPA